MSSRVKQPPGRLSSLFSCCFKGSEQPEITHCHDNVTSVAALDPNLPMPPLQELDSMFTELVVSARPLSGLIPSSATSFIFSFLIPYFGPRMNWILQTSTELTCLLCQQRRSGRSTAVRKWYDVINANTDSERSDKSQCRWEAEAGLFPECQTCFSSNDMLRAQKLCPNLSKKYQTNLFN